MDEVMLAASTALDAFRAAIEEAGSLPPDLAADLRALLDATTAIPEQLIIALPKVITVAGSEFAELKLCEPTAGEMEQWNSLTRIHADRKAISVVAKVPEAVVRQLPARIFNEAARYIARFLD